MKPAPRGRYTRHGPRSGRESVRLASSSPSGRQGTGTLFQPFRPEKTSQSPAL
jgi:hypothetical protein